MTSNHIESLEVSFIMGINLRAEISEYSNRVLGVIKEKYGLKDKSEAIDKFAEMYGEEFVDLEIKDEVLRDLISDCELHFRKHGRRKMSMKQLDKLFS